MLQHSRRGLGLLWNTRFLTIETKKKPITVSQYSSLQKKINEFASKPKNQPTLHSIMMESSNKSKNRLIQSCQYMRHEFLVRVAHVITHLQNLPYIILTNEDIKRVLDLYMYAFTDMLHQPVIRSMKDVDKFNENLSGLLEDLTDIILLLSKGIHDSQLHVNDPEFPATIGKTMDYIVINRLCNRILARHHLSMHIQREGYISVVNTDLSLKKVIQRNATFSANVCQNVYMETLPEVIIDGHADARVAFIPNIIDYVIREVLKNAFRATVENNLHQVEKPPIICTISNSADYWKIRVSDRGSGMSDEMLGSMEKYCFTSFKKKQEEQEYSQAFGEIVNPTVADRGGSSLAGFGVGIPVSMAYIRFVKGKMEYQSLPGIGTDVYIKVPQIAGLMDRLHI